MTLNRILEGKPFIIAEVGSNWSSLDDCLTSISLAKACGADAVKFQLYDEMALYGKMPDSGKMPGTLLREWLPKLKSKADAVGIEFMCSAFSPELLDEVNKYVNIHKLASAEMCHVRMLEKLRGYGKPVIISTGAQHYDDIGSALQILGDSQLILMYCVAAYPARTTQLHRMEELADAFRLPVGLSDHSLEVFEITKLAATAYNAVAIEKHVNFVEAQGPDSPHSLSAGEFQAMVKHLRETRYPINLFPLEEKPMITRHKRRLIVTRDVAAGEKLIEGENFGIYRSLQDDTRADSPFNVNKYNGRIAKGPLKAGQGLWKDDIE